MRTTVVAIACDRCAAQLPAVIGERLRDLEIRALTEGWTAGPGRRDGCPVHPVSRSGGRSRRSTATPGG